MTVAFIQIFKVYIGNHDLGAGSVCGYLISAETLNRCLLFGSQQWIMDFRQKPYDLPPLLLQSSPHTRPLTGHLSLCHGVVHAYPPTQSSSLKWDSLDCIISLHWAGCGLIAQSPITQPITYPTSTGTFYQPVSIGEQWRYEFWLFIWFNIKMAVKSVLITSWIWYADNDIP